MKNILLSLSLLLAAALGGCIEDSFTTAPADAPVASVDTLHLGTVFTDECTPTFRFTLHNRASKSVSISSISLAGDASDHFRINVDGFSGKEFHDVEIRNRDSIFIFVEATLPPNGLTTPVPVDARLDYTCNGVTRSVVLRATGRDAVRLHARTVTGTMDTDPARPYIVYDSLVVAPGATLNILPGTEMYFHDGAHMAVRGTLRAEGTPDAWIHMAGDRTGNVVSDISFDIMSRQWTGLFFTSTSSASVMRNVDMRNTWQGLAINGDPAAGRVPDLKVLNCRLHNSAGLVLEAVHASTAILGTELAEGGEGLLYLQGGEHTVNHCTLANYYLFSAISGPALQLAHTGIDGDDDGSGAPRTQLLMTNSIIYGLGDDLSHKDLSGSHVRLQSCLLKSAGTDDANFISCLWDTDPLYCNDRSAYVFDYRLQPDSPALGAADPSLTHPDAATDCLGHPRGTSPALGAYALPKE